MAMNTLSSMSSADFETSLTCSRLSPAMAMKHGYSNVDDYKNGVQTKFSLLKSGLLDKLSTRLLLINVRLPHSHKTNLLISVGNA